MKRIVFILASIFLMISCDGLFSIFETQEENESVDYSLLLNFKNNIGESISACLDTCLESGKMNYEIANDLYKLSVSPFPKSLKRTALIMDKESYSVPCLKIHFNAFVKDYKGVDEIVYQLWCPTLFHDDSIHKIVTSWTLYGKKEGGFYYPRCNRALVDDTMEITNILEAKYYANLVEIVLE